MEEICIKVPWGHIAGKLWGPRHIRPILMIHGWEDNAGTFDPLIPLLPRHVSYLAIDLPGHGLSSHLPNGMLYSHASFIYVLRLIQKKFKWKIMSLCGHSMGSVISYIYASVFPSEIDMVIALDALKPTETINNYLLKLYQSFDKSWNLDGKEPPSYSYDQIIDKYMNGTLSSYTEESLQYLLVRGIAESKLESNKYYFTRDIRLRSVIVSMVDLEVNIEMAGRITAPYCFVKSLQCGYSAKWLYMDDIMHKMKDSNPKFESHGVDGLHHVHLTEPEKVSFILGRYIDKHRRANILSKL